MMIVIEIKKYCNLNCERKFALTFVIVEIGRSRKNGRSRTFESLQFGGGIGGHGESSGSRSGRSPQCVVEGEAGPWKAQLAHTDAFIKRSRLRIQKLDQEREAEMELLNSALQGQARLREQIAAEPSAVAHPAPSDSGDELARFRPRSPVGSQSQHKSKDQWKLPKL